MTITRRPIIAVCLALAASGALAACGSSDDSSTQSASTPAATETATSTEATTTSTEDKTTSTATTEASAEGKQIFSENCASCHTLQDADASGQVGPNLDDLKPDEATVQKQVENGGGAMPAFKGQLTDAQIAAVAAYVSSSAGKS